MHGFGILIVAYASALISWIKLFDLCLWFVYMDIETGSL